MGRTNQTRPLIQEMLSRGPATVECIVATLGISGGTVRSCLTDHPDLFWQDDGRPALWRLRKKRYDH